MPSDDPEGYAALWLAELGAHVPEHRAGLALNPRDPAFGMHLMPAERAARNGARLTDEGWRVTRTARA